MGRSSICLACLAVPKFLAKRRRASEHIARACARPRRVGSLGFTALFLYVRHQLEQYAAELTETVAAEHAHVLRVAAVERRAVLAVHAQGEEVAARVEHVEQLVRVRPHLRRHGPG